MQDKLMAAPCPSNNDYFYPGSIVKCISCHEDVFQGEVLAFDYETKILLLKQPASCGKAELSNVAQLNMDFMKDVEVIKDCADGPIPPLTSLNRQKLLRRYKSEVELKNKLAKALKAGFSKEGLQLYLSVKHLFTECSLVEQNINIMDQVLIKPPYKSENCLEKDSKTTAASKRCLDYVKELVEKFHKEERLRSQTQPAEKT
uniref:Protein LSM12 homolog n=1 Tax=Phallusia mammillata TaxID=59560 RepID=A0A6F9DKJ8_9ASCI|nr:protein LSM12 homolog [Phallusia mammillata]